MFRFKPASRFVEGYHSAVSCGLNMKDLISINFCKSCKYKEIPNAFSVHFRKQLTDFQPAYVTVLRVKPALFLSLTTCGEVFLMKIAVF
jgi:hypothetical protein